MMKLLLFINLFLSTPGLRLIADDGDKLEAFVTVFWQDSGFSLEVDSKNSSHGERKLRENDQRPRRFLLFESEKSSSHEFTVEGMLKNLKDINSTKPLVVVTNTDSGEVAELKKKYDNLIVEVISKDNAVPIEERCSNSILPAYKIAWQKFHIYRMAQYSKLVMLDLDVFLKRNVDYVFDEKIQPVDENTIVGMLWGDGVCHDCKTLDDACPSGSFNGAMFMVKPSQGLYDKMMSAAQLTPCKEYRSDVVVNKALNEKQLFNLKKRHFAQKTCCQDRCNKAYDCDLVHSYHLGKWWQGYNVYDNSKLLK